MPYYVAYLLAEAAFMGLLAARVITLGRARMRYRAFLLFLAIQEIQLFAAIAFRPESWTYTQIWGWTEPVTLAAAVLATIEVLQRIRKYYPFDRRLTFVSVGLILFAAVTLSFLGAAEVLDSVIRWDRTPTSVYVQMMLVIERVVSGALALTVLTVWLLAHLFPANWPRNAYWHFSILVVQLTAMAAGPWAMHLSAYDPEVWKITAEIQQAVVLGCYAVWTVALTRDGERTICVPMPANTEMAMRSNDEAMALLRGLVRAWATAARESWRRGG